MQFFWNCLVKGMHDHHSMFDILGDKMNLSFQKALSSLFVLFSRCVGQTKEVDSLIIERHQKLISDLGYSKIEDLRSLTNMTP
jgi:hypothetical protein